MKKRIIAVLAALVLVFSLGASAYADGAGFIFDNDALLNNAEQYELAAQELYDGYGVAVCYLSAPSLDGMTIGELAQEFYAANIPYPAGLLFVDCAEADVYYIYPSGDAAAGMVDSGGDALISAYSDSATYDEAVKAYLNTAAELLAQMPSASGAAQASSAIPAQRQFARVYDETGLIPADTLAQLNALADSVSEEGRCDVAVVFVTDTAGKDIQAFADDFYDYNGYGYGDGDDGIMLAVDVNNRQFAVTTYGYGAYAFTDKGQEYMDEKYIPYLKNSEWAGAAEAFIKVSGELLTSARNGAPVDVGNMPKGSVSPVMILVDLVLGFLLALIPVGIMQSKLKTVVSRNDAADYIRQGSFRLDNSSDVFLYRRVNRTPRPKPQESSGGGGGSTMHTSSSGRSHGGHSGSF